MNRAQRRKFAAIREVALPLIAYNAQWLPADHSKNDNLVFEYEADGLKIVYATSHARFMEIVPITTSPEIDTAALLLAGLKTLPFRLNIWSDRRKVLNAEWDDRGKVHLVSFMTGPWERLLAAA